MKTAMSDFDLARALRPRGCGAPPVAQARVVQEILRGWGGQHAGPMPNLAEIGRTLGVHRQVVSHAVCMLRRKGVLAVREGEEQVVMQRKIRRGSIQLPDLDQYALPFEVLAATTQLAAAE